MVRNIPIRAYAMLLFIVIANLLFSQATIQFEKSEYALTAGEAVSICFELQSNNFDPNGYEIIVKFNGSSLPHFPDLQYQSFRIRSNSFCFPLESENIITYSDTISYEIEVIPVDANKLSIGDTNIVTIYVENRMNPKYLGPKDLLFIGFDNIASADGSDRLVLLNTLPITYGTKFLLTDAIPIDVSGRLFVPQSLLGLSALEIKYNDTISLPAMSEISILIRGGLIETDSSINFYINGQPTSQFTVTNAGIVNPPGINISDSTESTLTLVSGLFISGPNDTLTLQGLIIDGLSFATPNGQEENNTKNLILNVPVTGSIFGSLDCQDSTFLCDLQSNTWLVQSWIFGAGTTRDDLDTLVLIDDCVIEECPPVPLEIISSTALDSLDIVLLIDNSRSITAYHFEDLKEAVLDLVEGISSIIPNTRFAVVQYCEDFAFEVSVPFTFNSPSPISFDREFVGDSDPGAAMVNLIDELLYGQLTPRIDALLHTIHFTDAIGWKLITEGYTPYNELKSYPLQSLISMVRYNDWPMDVPIAASTTSIGGAYFGPLDPNSEDPDGSSLPRRLYIRESFDDPLEDVVNDIVLYNYLETNIDTSCLHSQFEWMAYNGGEIIQNNGLLIETNGTGLYILNLWCGETCTYSDTFNYNEIQPLVVPVTISTPQMNLVDHILSEKAHKLLLGDDNYFHVIPSLSNGLYYLHFKSIKTEDLQIRVYSTAGIEVLTLTDHYESNELYSSILDISHTGDGMYFILVQQGESVYRHKIVKSTN